MREPLGVILAGGRGSRMGTVSKADLILGGGNIAVPLPEPTGTAMLRYYSSSQRPREYKTNRNFG